MGDKTLAFVQKAYEYTKQYKDLVPTYLDVEAFAIDMNAVVKLRELTQTLSPISDALNDTLMLSASEAYQAALIFYNTSKAAAKVKEPNAASIYDDLSNSFPGRSTAKNPSVN